MNSLSKNTRETLEIVYKTDPVFIEQEWHELHETNPEIIKFILHESLRLFPTNHIDRSRATRFALEVIHALGVAEIEHMTSQSDN